MTSTGNDSSVSRLRNRLAIESQPIEETTRRAQRKHGKRLRSSVASAPSTTRRATAEVEKAELKQAALGMPPVMSSGRADPLLRRWGERPALSLWPGIFRGSWGTTRWLPPRIRRQNESKSWRRSVALPPGTPRPASRFSHEWMWSMTEIEQQLTAALRALSTQYEREQKQQAERTESLQEQVESLQEQVGRLEDAVTRLTGQYETLAQTLRS